LPTSYVASFKKLQGVIDNLGSAKEVLSQTDVAHIKATAEVAQIYAKRFKNFPAITRWRFWIWDIGVATLLTVIALGFALFYAFYQS
jgi:hypothetical protein